MEPERNTLEEGADVTREMVEAGVAAFSSYDPRLQEPEEMVREVWRAMAMARSNQKRP
jgi:hypothetical protein